VKPKPKTKPPKVKLYMFSGSHSVLTAQLMLAHKGVAYKRRNLPPAAHAPVLLGLGFETMTVPALKVDGRRVQGTRWISRELDELVPSPALFPADPGLRREVEAAERWGEDFQDALRRVFYCMARRDRTAFRKIILAERSLPMRAALRLAMPMIIRLASAKHDAIDAVTEVDVAELPQHLDRIDSWIAQGVLNGTDLNAADFQIAPSLAAMLISEDGAPFVKGRPAETLARRVAPDYTGRVGKAMAAGTVPPTLPPEWVARARRNAGARLADTVALDHDHAMSRG
jgi:glutathione S-transferase